MDTLTLIRTKCTHMHTHARGFLCCTQGRPVYIQLLGKVNVDAMKKCTNEERMIKFHIQEYERCARVILPVCSKLASKNIDQTFGIMDVKGERGSPCVLSIMDVKNCKYSSHPSCL